MLTPVNVPFTYLQPRFTDGDWRKVTRTAYSVDGYSPVRVTIYVAETLVHVKVDTMPDGRNGYWRHPNAAERRTLVDEVLGGVGLRRAGRVEHVPALGGNGWCWQYGIAKVGS